VKELKQLMSSLNIDSSDCIEKADLIMKIVNFKPNEEVQEKKK